MLKQTIEAIKSLRIQGAQAVAEAAVVALRAVAQTSRAQTSVYFLRELKAAASALTRARPTEPMMRNSLAYILAALKSGATLKELRATVSARIVDVLAHFESAQKLIVGTTLKKLRSGMIIYTHCHSSTVSAVLLAAKRAGMRFEVHNTETRPLYQGRRTARELAQAGIAVHHYVDSAMRLALKKADIALLGADAITAEGKVINKIGSELAAIVAARYDVPLYVCADSWKFDPTTLAGAEEPIELRPGREIWPRSPKGVVLRNWAFEKIAPELITAIISELGVLRPAHFVSEVQHSYAWMLG